MLFLAYIILCLIAGVLGRRSHIGFYGFFFISLLLTPLIGLAVVLLAAPRRLPKRYIDETVVRVEVHRD